MKVRFAVGGFGSLVAACCMLVLSTGCGDAPASSGSMPMKSGESTSSMPMKSGGDAGANTMPMNGAQNTAMTQKAGAYCCPMDGEVSATPEKCPKCGMDMKWMPVSNKDPNICPVSGDKIDKPVYAMVNGKMYAFCCSDCPKAMMKDPAKYGAPAAPAASDSKMSNMKQ
ncbi:MAG: heavy metal-binding domain-containing protein [Planctomycetota bacterium]